MKPHVRSILEMPELEPWPEPVDGMVLLDRLEGLLRRIVVLPAWAPEALSLFNVHTYAFQLRDISTCVGVESRKNGAGRRRFWGCWENWSAGQ